MAANSNRSTSEPVNATAEKLLLVSRRNLAQVVQGIAPELTLVNREEFTRIATAMLEVVEAVAHHETPATAGDHAERWTKP